LYKASQLPVLDRVAAPRAEVSNLHNLSLRTEINSVLLWYVFDQDASSN